MRGHPKVIREINRKNIIEALRQSAPLSRTELAKKVHLSLPSVSRIINALLEEGVLLEVGKGDSRGGRKPTLLEFNPHHRFVFGVDVSREITVVLCDLQGTIVERRKIPVSPSFCPQNVVETVLREIESIKQYTEISENRVVGLGVSTPGFLFKATRMVESSPFAGWESADVETLFVSRSPYPVTIDNVARASAMAEILYGWGSAFHSFFYFYLDWGTGGGVVYRGKIVRGLSGSCGEVGHSTIDPEGVLCYCGNRGCLEQYTSTAALLRNLKREMGEEMDFAEMISRYREGDPVVVNVLRRAGYFLGKGIANIINILNPQAVVLGGELGRLFPLYVEEAIASARENIFSLSAQETPIVVSRVGKEEVVLAVAQMVLARYLEEIG